MTNAVVVEQRYRPNVGEQEFRSGGALRTLLFGLGGLGLLALLAIASSTFERLMLVAWAWSGGYQMLLATRTLVVVDDRAVRIRWAVRSRTIERADIVDVRRRRHVIRLVLAPGHQRGSVTLPVVRETDGLERALRNDEHPQEVPPELVVHQGGLVRRWTGPVYTP